MSGVVKADRISKDIVVDTTLLEVLTILIKRILVI